jgi:hypothetical protein
MTMAMPAEKVQYPASDAPAKGTTTMRFLVIAAISFATFGAAAQAAGRGTYSDGNGHIVHSRRAPVIVHRVFPPYTGIHVYQGRR